MAANDNFPRAYRFSIHRPVYAVAVPPGEDINERGERGETALHSAARGGQLASVRDLVEAGARLDVVNDDGDAPLTLAQREMRSAVAAYLIECAQLTRALARRLQKTPTQDQVHDALYKEVGAEFRDHELARIVADGTRMIAAARAGDLTEVRRALESDEVDVNTVYISTGETAFSASLASGWHKVCDYLLENGAHAYAPCVVNGKTQSAPVTAVQNDDAEFVRRLLAHGVHFSVTHDLTTCALQEAVNNGSDEMLDALLNGGAYFQRVRGPGLLDIVVDVMGAKRFDAEDGKIWQRLAVACWLQDLRRIRHLFATCEQLQDRAMVAVHAADAPSSLLFTVGTNLSSLNFSLTEPT